MGGEKPDLLQSTIGNFGKWQCRIAICMALLKLPIAWFQVGIVFLAPQTDFWCRQPEDYKMWTVQKWLATIAAYKNESNYDPSAENCMMRNIELVQDTKLQPCKWGYDYNKTIIHSSIITEWNLVCGQERWVDFTQMVLMLGVLLGNILFGILADKYGRKKILIICIFMQSICGTVSAWSLWFSVFLGIRFFMALANGGTMISSFVMCMEVVGGNWRSIVAILYHIPFGLGNTIMAGVAYYFRDWRTLQLSLSISSGLFVLYIWAIPESPRWLLATGRRREAAKVLERAAVSNGQDVEKLKEAFLLFPRDKSPNKPKMLAIFSNPNLRQRSALLCTNWFIAGITFYGFSTYLGQIATNIYLMVSIAGIITIPGILFCIFIVRKCGRRWTLVSSYLVIAFCFYTIIFVPSGVYPQDWPKMMVAAFGVMGLSVSMSALYLFTGELYPTTLRNLGMGGCIMFSRIGSLLSPFVISLKELQNHLPLLTLGTLTIVQLFLILMLPESGGMLPETINDIEMNVIVNNNIIMNSNYVPVPLKAPEEDKN